ncbi:MAG: hypothetical protein JXA24_00895 [Proteobacteria bacterium]|nr:hypothetical protein [Pseudomonadota bacterium]
MVEKIDRPDAPNPYAISQAKETKEDRHQQHNPKEDAERERQRRIEGKEWQKFGRRTVVIKPLRVGREKIRKCLFKSVNLHSGIGTLKVDLIWADGRRTENALMLVRMLEDFLKLRSLSPGEEVPEALWVRGPTVEIGIPHVIAEAGALSGREIEASGRPSGGPGPRIAGAGLLLRLGIVDAGTGGVNWGLVLMYAFVGVLAVAAVAAMISKLD